ncbi:MAG: gliding motility-associated protein GldE [Methylococcaceae bacterium]|nr:gliding motility-associated protein GldE [Prolixibacteraceae bacterium]
METAPILLLNVMAWNVEMFPVTWGITLSLIMILVLLLCSALISGSEVAYFSLDPSERQKIADTASKENTYILKNLKSPEQLLATLQVANNFINVCIIVLSSLTLNQLFKFPESPLLAFVFQITVISLIIILIGKIIPKLYSSNHALKLAGFLSVPLYYMVQILKPVNSVFISSTSSLLRKREQINSHQLSVDQLSHALELTSEYETKEDKDILKGIVQFGNKNVADIMQSRVDVVAADIRDNYSKILSLITGTGFSRIPVYSETFDDIKGILYIKDILPYVNKGDNFRWQNLIRPPFYVPETKKIDVLLEEFQKNKVHMAIVVDEYGGSSGIVTLEDILEEIVGEITDEFDEEEPLYTKISDNKYIFDGKILIEDFLQTIGQEETLLDNIKGEADTLAGLILELKGEIPEKEDVISCKNMIFTVDSVDNRRIKKIKVEINPSEQ